MPSRRSHTPSFHLTRSQQRALIYLGLLLALALIALLWPQFQLAPQTSPTPPLAQAETPPWLTVYFTNPNPPDDINNGIDRFIVPLIEAATRSVDVASFDINLPSVVNALVQAHRRGVTVRVVYDGKNGDAEVDNDAVGVFNGVETLQKAGIELVDGGRSNGLMHNKIILIDAKTLVMGSWNVSYNDTFRNNNNVLIITATPLIANYQAKFDEMFVEQRFGAKAKVGALKPSLNLEGVAVENYFSPVDEVMEKLVAYVQAAKQSIHFYAFAYTHADLSAAMLARANVGVDVQGIIENRGASQGALVPLFCAQLPVKTDGNKYTMHHKVIIIDGQIVITGSFNFTKSADEANDDNILVIHNAAVAKLYEQEYQRLLALAQSPDPAEISCK